MITLGLNAAFHDSAAALVRDGVLVAAVEEERFTRIKHAKRPVPFTAWELPFNAIDFCLKSAGITLGQVDHVAYSYRPHDPGAAASIALPLHPGSPGAEGESPWDPLFQAYILNAPGQLLDGAPHHLQARLADGRGADGQARHTWHWVDHHLAHQASAFLAAPFERCAVLTLDGRGERATTSYGRYALNRYDALGEVCMPHSLGLLYERITTHLGFLHSSDEYKVMALAAMGEPRYADALRAIVRLRDDGQYEVRPFDPALLFGPQRARGAPLEQRHFDLAASLQLVLEGTVLRLARWLRDASGERLLAMAGGVALNCLMNSRLRDSGLFDAVWVQPAAGDAGTALGAALLTDARERSAEPAALAPRAWTMQHAYWGPSFDDAGIEQQLTWARRSWRAPVDLAGEVAQLLADNRIVGWFQGAMEFGPRALGGRSILASPVDPAMQDRLNDLKDREDFRPVAPVVPIELLSDWFEPAEANGGASPFMLFVYRVKPGKERLIPAVCHVDDSARVQTVRREDNPRLHALLHAFAARTGVPVLVNTSFNVRGEPVVCTPRDALDAYGSTPIDALVLGHALLEKRR